MPIRRVNIQPVNRGKFEISSLQDEGEIKLGLEDFYICKARTMLNNIEEI